jgi:ubiquinone/menaquinone biosynthesis C-methylase UbiE
MHRSEAFDEARGSIFDALAPQWDQEMEFASLESFRELMGTLEVSGKVVLDVGAGTGVLVESGLEAGAKSWIACDLSGGMLAVLAKKFQKALRDGRLSLLRADVHSLPLEKDSVERVVCQDAFPHFHDLQTAFREIFRILRPGGCFAINHFAGREFINSIHRASSHPILREDLMIPAVEAIALLQETGFEVKRAIDEESRFFILAAKPEL